MESYDSSEEPNLACTLILPAGLDGITPDLPPGWVKVTFEMDSAGLGYPPRLRIETLIWSEDLEWVDEPKTVLH